MREDRRRLILYICRKTHNWEEAEEIVQDAFLTAFRKIGSFRGDSQLRSWVTRIAINYFLMRLRKRKDVSWEDAADIEYLKAEGDLEAETINKLDYAKLQGLIDRMPKCYATTLTMRGQGMMYKDIAKVMGYSVGAAKGYVNRGKAKLLRSLYGASQ